LRDPLIGSRSWFGNTGLRVEQGKYEKVWFEARHFSATHAGLGGEPWEGDHPKSHHPETHYVPGSASMVPRTVAASRLERLTGKTPTITEEGDKKGSAAAKSWMWRKMRDHGVLDSY
jgi:hypothetical protein